LYNQFAAVIAGLPAVCSASLAWAGEGSFGDWVDYSVRDLFAYDNQDAHRTHNVNRYDLITRPESPLPLARIPNSATFVPILVPLGLRFASSSVIAFSDVPS
jgi:hypothetical protein